MSSWEPRVRENHYVTEESSQIIHMWGIKIIIVIKQLKDIITVYSQSEIKCKCLTMSAYFNSCHRKASFYKNLIIHA